MSKTTPTKKPEMGRPKKDADKKRGEWIGAAVTAAEKRAFCRSAEDAGRKAGEHIRVSLGISID
jgi:hypothetical protein